MGTGGSLEAAFSLAGPIKAGSWHLVGDGVAFDPCDVTFAVVWRGSDGVEHPIVSFSNNFPESGPPVNGYAPAIALDADAMGVAAPALAGDELVLRFTVTSATNATVLFIPNGDGPHAKGRIPSLTLPQ